MSKERDLLESCLDEMQYHNLVCPELKIDIQEFLAQPERGFLSNTEKMELHAKLRQQGSLTQDGYWDAIEAFQKFLQECEEKNKI